MTARSASATPTSNSWATSPAKRRSSRPTTPPCRSRNISSSFDTIDPRGMLRRVMALSGRLEHRDRQTVVHCLERDRDRQADGELRRIDADHVAEHDRPFVELDQRDGVGDLVLPGRMIGAIENNERKHLPA